MYTTNHMREWLTGILYDTWAWFSRLSQQEWMVLLAVVALLGFLCMRGFTQRGTL